MTYINCEQDHIDNNIRHIFIKKNNNKKKTCNEQHKYISIKRKEK